MIKEKITITVSGRAKIGKTTIAIAIAKGLEELFDIDMDISCFGDSDIFDILMDDDEFEKRIGTVAATTSIHLEEKIEGAKPHD